MYVFLLSAHSVNSISLWYELLAEKVSMLLSTIDIHYLGCQLPAWLPLSKWRADLLSDSQRIKYTLETFTKGVPDARMYLNTLQETRKNYICYLNRVSILFIYFFWFFAAIRFSDTKIVVCCRHGFHKRVLFQWLKLLVLAWQCPCWCSWSWSATILWPATSNVY